MELCTGGALDSIYRQYPKPLNEDHIASVMFGTCKGIAYLHEEYFLIHRDIKSGNIFLTEDGTVKLGKLSIVT